MAARETGVAAVAQRAGVSTATVSNVINWPERVTPGTRAKVEAAMSEVGFVPNRVAAGLRTGSSRLLGLVVPAVQSPFYAAIIDAVVDAADRHDHTVALCVSHDDPATELRQVDTLAQQRAAGVVVVPGAIVVPGTADSSRLSNLRRVGSRMVLVDRVADVAECCSVAVDDRLGGTLAVRHLLDRPGEGMALVNGLRSIPQCSLRREGARDALAAAGLDPGSLVEVESKEMSVEAGVEIGRRLAVGGGPRRIFCANDQLALGVVRGLQLEAVRVPDDAAVVGYGDVALPVEGGLGLTTISHPKREMGVTAVERLLAELREGAAHQHSRTLFEPTLLERDSTRRAG